VLFLRLPVSILPRISLEVKEISKKSGGKLCGVIESAPELPPDEFYLQGGKRARKRKKLGRYLALTASIGAESERQQVIALHKNESRVHSPAFFVK
jgi:hypothetical protein